MQRVLQRFFERGRLRESNAFVEAQKAVRHAAVLRAKDLSFEEFLKKKPELPAATRKLATMMVQGFDAADPARVSARDRKSVV